MLEHYQRSAYDKYKPYGVSEMLKVIAVGASLLIIPVLASSQTESSGQTLASTIDVFVFPTKGQDASQQSMEEVECYEWASASVGTDPFELIEQQEADEQLSEAEMAAAEQAGGGADGTVVRAAAAGDSHDRDVEFLVRRGVLSLGAAAAQPQAHSGERRVSQHPATVHPPRHGMILSHVGTCYRHPQTNFVIPGRGAA